MISVLNGGFAHEVTTDHKADDFLENTCHGDSDAEVADQKRSECDNARANKDGVFGKIEVRIERTDGDDGKKGCDNESQNQG